MRQTGPAALRPVTVGCRVAGPGTMYGTRPNLMKVRKMARETGKDLLSRRGFLGVSSAALAAASVLGPDRAEGQEQTSAQNPKGDRSASDPGPTNAALDAANPDSNHPLPTDAGGVQTFKYPFSFAHKRFQEGGWSREVTIRELAVSKSLAGVDMRLTAGGVRELHWHTAAEWAYMLYGSARITCVDFDGKSFVTDVREGDLWYFPPGIPHSIQGLAPDGAEFMLVFDDGNFSEYETVLLTDWMAHTPPVVVAKNFGVAQAVFGKDAEERKVYFSGRCSRTPCGRSAHCGRSARAFADRFCVSNDAAARADQAEEW